MSNVHTVTTMDRGRIVVQLILDSDAATNTLQLSVNNRAGVLDSRLAGRTW